MKKLSLYIGSTGLLLLPFLVSAQQFDPTGGVFGTFLANILVFINNVLIPFILGIGFLLFVWGMFQFFIAGGANEEAREKGKNLMIYAVLGFVIIIVFWGIINIVANGTGLGGQPLDAGLLPQTVPTGAN